MQGPRRRAQERVQHVLPQLHERRALLPLPRPPPRPSLHPDTAVFVPRRDPGVGDTKSARHHRRADVHHQQCARGVPQRAAAAPPRQGRHQHLRGLRAQPPRLLPLLLPRMQDCRHVPWLPPQEEAGRRHRRQQEEEGGAQGRAVGLGGLVPEHQRRRQQRQEQRRAELLAHDPAADQLPPLEQAAQGRPAPVALRQPHRRALGQGTVLIDAWTVYSVLCASRSREGNNCRPGRPTGGATLAKGRGGKSARRTHCYSSLSVYSYSC